MWIGALMAMPLSATIRILAALLTLGIIKTFTELRAKAEREKFNFKSWASRDGREWRRGGSECGKSNNKIWEIFIANAWHLWNYYVFLH